MRSTIKPLAIVLAAAVGVAGAAAADEMGGAETITIDTSRLSDAEMDARISFISERLDGQQQHAYYWQYGWLGFYGAGMVIQSARAAATGDDEHDADYIVSAVKAAGGVARMYLAPHPSTRGADPIREMGGSSRASKERKLAKAEEMLLEAGKFADRRSSEKAHVTNVLVNVAGGAIIWGLGSPMQALESTLVGVAVGAANILTAPWNADDDVDAYRARFGMGTAKKWNWKVVPTMGGAAVHVTW